MKRCDGHIKRAFELSRQLAALADSGQADSRDDGCRLLYGIVRDCAYRIRKEAERERVLHGMSISWETAQNAEQRQTKGAAR